LTFYPKLVYNATMLTGIRMAGNRDDDNNDDAEGRRSFRRASSR